MIDGNLDKGPNSKSLFEVPDSLPPKLFLGCVLLVLGLWGFGQVSPMWLNPNAH